MSIRSHFINEKQLNVVKVAVSNDQNNQNSQNSILTARFCIFDQFRDWISTTSQNDDYNFMKYEALVWIKNQINGATEETKFYRLGGVAISLVLGEEDNLWTLGLTFLHYRREFIAFSNDSQDPIVGTTIDELMLKGFERKMIRSFDTISGITSTGELIPLENTSDYTKLKPNKLMPTGKMESWNEFCGDVNREVFKAGISNEFMGKVKGIRRIDPPDTVKWQIALNHLMGKSMYITMYQYALLRSRSVEDFEVMCIQSSLAAKNYEDKVRELQTSLESKTYELLPFTTARPTRDFSTLNGLKYVFNGRLPTTPTVHSFDILTLLRFPNVTRTINLEGPQIEIDQNVQNFF